MTATEKHLDKANSLLDEISREERSGYKAEIAGFKNKVEAISNEPSPDNYKNPNLDKSKKSDKQG